MIPRDDRKSDGKTKATLTDGPSLLSSMSLAVQVVAMYMVVRWRSVIPPTLRCSAVCVVGREYGMPPPSYHHSQSSSGLAWGAPPGGAEAAQMASCSSSASRSSTPAAS